MLIGADGQWRAVPAEELKPGIPHFPGELDVSENMDAIMTQWVGAAAVALFKKKLKDLGAQLKQRN